MNLLSWEKKLLAHFVTASDVQRAQILSDARNDPKVSGALIYWYDQLMST